MHRLILKSSTFEGGRIELSPSDLPVVLGRSSSVDLSISDGLLSRRHSEIRRNAAGNFEIHDLDSTNLTIVNEQDVTQHELKSGDLILLGDTEISVEIDDSDVDFSEKTTREFQLPPDDRATNN